MQTPIDILRKLVAGEIVDTSEVEVDDVQTVLLRGAHIERMLSRYQNKEIDEQYLETWANLVQARLDIIYEEKNKEVIGEVLTHMANSELQGKLSKTLIEAYFKVIK